MKLRTTFLALFAALILTVSASAQAGTHTVQAGDSMWKIAVKYQIGLSELVEADPQIQNPALIYPGQKISIPNIDDVLTNIGSFNYNSLNGAIPKAGSKANDGGISIRLNRSPFDVRGIARLEDERNVGALVRR